MGILIIILGAIIIFLGVCLISIYGKFTQLELENKAISTRINRERLEHSVALSNLDAKWLKTESTISTLKEIFKTPIVLFANGAARHTYEVRATGKALCRINTNKEGQERSKKETVLGVLALPYKSLKGTISYYDYKNVLHIISISKTNESLHKNLMDLTALK